MTKYQKRAMHKTVKYTCTRNFAEISSIYCYSGRPLITSRLHKINIKCRHASILQRGYGDNFSEILCAVPEFFTAWISSLLTQQNNCSSFNVANVAIFMRGAIIEQ